MTDRDELRRRLDAAYKLDPDDNGGTGKETYWRTMLEILGEAEALGDTGLLFEARLAYGWSLRGKAWKKDTREIFTEWLGLLRQCLTMWRAEPGGLPEHNVTAMWNQFFNVLDIFIRIYPEPAERIRRLIDELERQCPPSRTETLRVFDWYRLSLAARRGDLDAMDRLWERLRVREGPVAHLVPDGSASVAATMWQRLGRHDRAIEALAPVLSGQVPSRGDRLHVDGLILPYLRTGRTGDAVAAHQRTYAKTGMKLEALASHLEFCARTGNEERGLDVLHRNLERVRGPVTTVEEMWTAAAVALLCRRVTERDLDEEWVWARAGDTGGGAIWSYAEFGGDRRWAALTFALHVDELDGTSHHREAIMRRLHAEPVAESLALPPPVSEPAHRLTPSVSERVDAATADDLQKELTRVGELDRRGDRLVRLQYLMQNAIATGERDALLDIRFAYLDELLSCAPTAWRSDLFSVVVSLARTHDADPARLGAVRLGRLWSAVPVALDRVLTRATVHAAQVRGLIGTLGRHCRPGTDDEHHLRWYEVELEVRRGDVAAARAAWAAFESLPSRDVHSAWPDVLRRAGWWLDLGLDIEVLGTMGPALYGKDGEECLLVPYLRTGQEGRAREIHERTLAAVDGPRALAAHLEFCARTGDLARLKDIIQGSLGAYHVFYDDSEFTFDDLRSRAAVVLASRRIAGRGLDETWTWPADACCPPDEGWTYTRLADACRLELDLFGTRWEELTGTDFYTRRLTAIADGPAPPG